MLCVIHQAYGSWGGDTSRSSVQVWLHCRLEALVVGCLVHGEATSADSGNAFHLLKATGGVPEAEESLLRLDNWVDDGPALLFAADPAITPTLVLQVVADDCFSVLASRILVRHTPLRQVIHTLHHLAVDLDFASRRCEPRRWQ